MNQKIFALRSLLASATFATAFVLATHVHAAEQTTANINRGNINVGGSADFSHVTSNPKSTQFNLYPKLEYFVLNRFSVGGAAIVTIHSQEQYRATSTSWGMGPSATYYFWAKNTLTTYVHSSFMYNNYHYTNREYATWETDSDYFSMTWSLGLKYFFTPSVALGPEIIFNHLFANDNYESTSAFGWAAAFSVHL